MKNIVGTILLSLIWINMSVAGTSATEVKITALRAFPIDFTRQSGLKIETVLSDKIGLYTFEYLWTLNHEVSYFETEASLKPGVLTFDTPVIVQVSVFSADGELIDTYTSPEVYVQNSQPQITGTTNVTITRTNFQCQILASDADEHTLTFELIDMPDGMKIDARSGLITWKYTEFPEAKHTLHIRVNDEFNGSTSQKFIFDFALDEAS